MMRLKQVFPVLLLLAGLGACHTLERQVRLAARSGQYFTGFYLYDPQRHKVLANWQGDKYFTPASNTKILTLYAVQHFLPDSLPAFYLWHDSLATHLWPTGYPGFLNPVLADTLHYRLLSGTDSLVLHLPGYTLPRFGPGWAWDDYPSSYSPECSPFPILGNLACFSLDPLTGQWRVIPRWLRDSVTLRAGHRFGVTRQEWHNRFLLTPDTSRSRPEVYVPLRLHPRVVQRLWADTLRVAVTLTADSLPRPPAARLYYGLPADTVLKVMLQESDNFLAEQLLLQAGYWLSDTLTIRPAIDSASALLATVLPDPLIWVDGSGLSRYNMTTPRNLVHLWEVLLAEMGEKRLQSLLAAGGKSGTIKNWYVADPPYIYGKTGTLRHNHVLSGLLYTRRGRLLLFAWTHNHYQTGSGPVKQEMERILRLVYEKY